MNVFRTWCGTRLWKSWLWQDSVHALFGPRAQLPPPKPSAITDCETKSSNWYETDPETRLWHRRYVTTHEGFIGIGPPDVQEGDIICVFLGFDTPVVLRPLPRSPSPPPSKPLPQSPTSPLLATNASDKYLFVGPIVVYGLQDSLSLLGPLPTPWRVILRKDGISTGHNGTYITFIIGKLPGEVSDEDPRLPQLGEGEWTDWERVSGNRGKRTADDPAVFQRFRNQATGDIITHDPRMSPDALRARGAPIREFILV